MRFCVLASGSHGNATWIEEGGKAVLVDNGLSAKELKARVLQKGLNLSRLEAIAISHEHSDHVSGVGPLARQLNLTVFAVKAVAGALSGSLKNVRVRTFSAGDELDLKFLTLVSVPVSHDAADPVAFVAKGQSATIGIVTDLGKATHLVRESFKSVDALMVEFNHDPAMLIDGPYPIFLKKRVSGQAGHLSNEAGAELLGGLCHERLRRVILGHLSETNNTPELALKEARRELERRGVSPELIAAGQTQGTPVFDL
jgi:phosphoribosyl 1,2-cyclic phosphodiesterase